MILAKLSESELEALLVQAVDAWLPGASGQPNSVDIFHHWRGRPSESSKSMITMLECARVAWYRARNAEDAFDNVSHQAKRLLRIETEQQYIAPRGSLFISLRIARALAHVLGRQLLACPEDTRPGQAPSNSGSRSV